MVNLLKAKGIIIMVLLGCRSILILRRHQCRTLYVSNRILPFPLELRHGMKRQGEPSSGFFLCAQEDLGTNPRKHIQ